MQQKGERATCAYAAYRKCEHSSPSRKTTEPWKEVNKPDQEALKATRQLPGSTGLVAALFRSSNKNSFARLSGREDRCQTPNKSGKTSAGTWEKKEEAALWAA